MNAPTAKLTGKLDLIGCQHWSDAMPYRAIVAIKEQNPNGPILYQVAGIADNPCGAINALKLALKKHGGTCFYCKKAAAAEKSLNFTLDHVQAIAVGGKDDLGNLVVACKPCNAAKSQGAIETFNPRATRDWLTALQDQTKARLARLS